MTQLARTQTTARKNGAPCLKSCGRWVISPSGKCSHCRTVVCKRCGLKLRQKFDGQLVHTKCHKRAGRAA